MTEKLYYEDAYIKAFDATVLSCTKLSESFAVVLDKTAFFPEEGGQTSDKGYIDGVRVLDVKEKDGIIVHTLESPTETGKRVKCSIDFDERFEKMQCHTAEHILCGIIHKLYGFENVGFHLSADEVVFDVDGVLDREQIVEVESIANGAVYEDRLISTAFPSADELPSLQYRAKLELTENVRIVNIDGYDSCACCAPHVSHTGEIGIIAITGFEKHRGGTRIYMLAGRRAERDYRDRRRIARLISAITSEPQETIHAAVEKLANDNENLRQNLKAAKLKEASLLARLLPPTDKNAVVFHPELAIPELIEYSNQALEKVDGILVALSGEEKNYKYVISSHTVDLRAMAKEINASLSGRGGGRPEMIQGSFACALSEIEKYFSRI